MGLLIPLPAMASTLVTWLSELEGLHPKMWFKKDSSLQMIGIIDNWRSEIYVFQSAAVRPLAMLQLRFFVVKPSDGSEYLWQDCFCDWAIEMRR